MKQMVLQKKNNLIIIRKLSYYYKIKDVDLEGVECDKISCCFEWFLAYKYLISLYTLKRIKIMSI